MNMGKITREIIGLAVFCMLCVAGNIVKVEEGEIEGTRLIFTDETVLNLNRTVDIYRGIPYAEPPIGEKRFKSPEPSRAWGSKPLNGTKFRNACPQTNPNIQSVETDEDCLYLNVFVPVSEMTTLRPVMVYFHGGAFLIGTSSNPEFDPMVLSVVGNLIIVNVNYRLGIFGFLTTGDDEGQGNYGMLDQVLALKWINNNIKAFGGDPSKITIFGESAGAASVHLHLLSPLSRDLFHQGIMQSGSAICGWAVELNMNKAIGDTRKVGHDLNCEQPTTKEFLNCLRNKTTDEIILAQRKVVLQTINVIPFIPTVDGYFLTDEPAKLLKNGKFKSANILIGNNKDEGTLWALRAYPAYITRRNAPEMLLPEFRNIFPDYVYWYKDPHAADAIEQQYIDWSVVDDSKTDHFRSFVELTTDQSFACPANDVARAHAANGDDVYRYEMTHVPKTSVWTLKKIVGPKWMGVTHGEDIPFMFGWGFNDVFEDRYGKQPEDEKIMSAQFMSYWTNFANYGDPNGNSSRPTKPKSSYPPWPKFTLPDLEYKQLSKEMLNGRALRADGCSFWRNYIPRLATFTDEISDLEKEWRESYYTWKYDDMPNWMTTFKDYKNNGECETP